MNTANRVKGSVLNGTYLSFNPLKIIGLSNKKGRINDKLVATKQIAIIKRPALMSINNKISRIQQQRRIKGSASLIFTLEESRGQPA